MGAAGGVDRTRGVESFNWLGRTHPWKPDGIQTDSNYETTERHAAYPYV